MSDKKDDRADEPTAAAVLANPDLDPVLAAKLRSWFDSGEDKDSDGEPKIAPHREKQAKLEELLSHADDELVSRIVDHDYRMTRDYVAGAAFVGQTLTGFVPVVQLKLRVPELVVEQIPSDVSLAMREDNTPQALLRDLHRLEWHFDPGARQEYQVFTAADAPQKEAIAAAFAAYDKVRHVPVVGPEGMGAYAAIAEMRETLATDWHADAAEAEAREELDS